MPDLPVTVPQSLHDAMAQSCGEAFAISYLCGALLDGATLYPRTEIAKERLKDSGSAMRVLNARGYALGRSLTPAERAPIPGVPKLAESPTPRPWRPISDAEYARLSLTDKIRQHTQMALEARTRAGPMWKRGRPAGAEEMSDRWHELIAKAQNHEAEVSRLRAMLNEPTKQAAE